MRNKQEEFKRRFFHFHPKLYRIAYSILGNQDDAEDLLQELYLKLWTNYDKLGELNKAEAYCVTLLKNLCIDHLRSRKVPDQCFLYELPDVLGEDMPDKAIEVRSELGIVSSIISQLPEKQQTVLRLQSIEGMELKEIEDITGLSNGNVRTMLSRARKIIKEQFEKLNK